MNRSTPTTSHAFTLLEVMAVIAIMSILALAVVPSIRSAESARADAAAREVQRMIVGARDRSIATGRSHGLGISAGSSSLRLLELRDGTVHTPPAWNGLPEPPLQLGIAYPGVALASFVSGDGSTTTTSLWFAADGTPLSRSALGVAQPAWTSDAVLTLTTGHSVTIRRGSGLVEGP